MAITTLHTPAHARPHRPAPHYRRRERPAPVAFVLQQEEPLAPARGVLLGAIGGTGLWGLIIWGALQLHGRLS